MPSPARRTRLTLQTLEPRDAPAVLDTVGLVRDINPGPGGSSPGGAVNVNGVVFFAADDGATGRELWRSDGTPVGTFRVADINPGAGGSGPSQLTNVNGVLFFAADDGATGSEPWRSDGTAAGTSRVADINPGAGGSGPTGLTAVGGALFFAATDGATGRELWATDGTPAGTAQVTDINPGAGGSDPQNLTAAGGTLFFRATDGVSGRELWATGGAAGTRLVKDIRPGANPFNSSDPSELTAVGGAVFFRANDGAIGSALWKTDGTAAGTVLVKDVNLPTGLTAVGGTLFFAASDGVTGNELWRSDGTAAGTALVKDIRPGNSPAYPALPADSNPQNLTAVGGRLFFRADDGVAGAELWTSDGTAAGTSLVADINTGTGPFGAAGSNPTLLTAVGGVVYFRATDGATGYELWKSDGTAAGTVLVKDINPGGDSFTATVGSSVLSVGNVLFLLSVTDGTTGLELFTDAITPVPVVLPTIPPVAPPVVLPVAPVVLTLPGVVVVLDPLTGRQTVAPAPFGSIPANVAVGDLTGDGVADYAFVPGPGGGPVLNVVDGATGAAVANLFALPGADFRGGLSVAVGAGAGGPVVAVGAGAGGGPFVRLYDARTWAVTAEFFAFDPGLRCGVTVALADVTGDGVDDLIVGTGPGVEAQVKVIDGTKLGRLGANGVAPDSALVAPAFLPFPGFTGGVFPAAGDLDGDPFADAAVTPGTGGGPFYAVYRGADLVARNSGAAAVRAGLPDVSFRGGLRVTVADADGNGTEDVVLTPGPGGGPVLFGFDPVTGRQVLATTVGDPDSRAGGSVG